MKKSTLLPLLCLAAALPLLWTGCKKDPPCDDPLNPECPNYDRCLTVPKTNAEFIVTDWTRPGQIPLPYRDTIPVASSVRVEFRAADRNMSRYEWKIGNDPRVFTDTSFYLSFDNVSGWINFSLTSYNDKADAICFPGDSGKITVNKAYFFKTYTYETDDDFVVQYPIFGTYLGADVESPQDTFQVTIDHWTQSLYRHTCIVNLPRGCSRLCNDADFNTHFFVAYALLPPHPDDLLCASPNRVFAELMPDNKTIEINYEFTSGGQLVKRKWKGTKLY
ncbi:MAG TPA: hypothetical protein PLL53_21950 [Saprospiraceae bacterium]|nr:hypothetical protein [Saprospiraceae bacterium]